MRRVGIRRNSLSIIISGCNSSRGVRNSAAISISTSSYHNDANRRSWQQQQQQRWSSCCWYKPTSIQSPQIPIQRVHHFSSLINDATNKCDDDDKQEEIKLVSIHDHLDELHDIPLADVRNFCIIAHVVSKLVLRVNNWWYTIDLHCPLTVFAIYALFIYIDAPNLHM